MSESERDIVEKIRALLLSVPYVGPTPYTGRVTLLDAMDICLDCGSDLRNEKTGAREACYCMRDD